MKFVLTKQDNSNKKKVLSGFTIIEMLAVLAIFTFLTTAVIIKYPDSALKLKVSNIVSDLSADLHEAQLKASSVDTLGQSTAGYGVHIDGVSKYVYKQFADRVTGNQINGIYIGDKIYNGSNENYKTVTLPTNFRINDICVSTTTIVRPFSFCRSVGSFGDLTVTYERPNPLPDIFVNNSTSTVYTSACIEIVAEKILSNIASTTISKGYVRNIIVTKTGLISTSLGTCS